MQNSLLALFVVQRYPPPPLRPSKAIAMVLTETVGTAVLKELNLSWNSLRQESASAIARALNFNSSLEVLNLAHNAFNDLPSQELGNALRVNTSLKVQWTKMLVTEIEKKLYIFYYRLYADAWKSCDKASWGHFVARC